MKIENSAYVFLILRKQKESTVGVCVLVSVTQKASSKVGAIEASSGLGIRDSTRIQYFIPMASAHFCILRPGNAARMFAGVAARI